MLAVLKCVDMFVIEKSLLLTDSEHKALYTDADGKASLKVNRFSGSDLSTGLPFNLNGPHNNPSIICLLVNDSLSLRFSSLEFSVFS